MKESFEILAEDFSFIGEGEGHKGMRNEGHDMRAGFKEV